MFADQIWACRGGSRSGILTKIRSVLVLSFPTAKQYSIKNTNRADLDLTWHHRQLVERPCKCMTSEM